MTPQALLARDRTATERLLRESEAEELHLPAFLAAVALARSLGLDKAAAAAETAVERRRARVAEALQAACAHGDYEGDAAPLLRQAEGLGLRADVSRALAVLQDRRDAAMREARVAAGDAGVSQAEYRQAVAAARRAGCPPELLVAEVEGARGRLLEAVEGAARGAAATATFSEFCQHAKTLVRVRQSTSLRLHESSSTTDDGD